jgi:hypothetical protein
MGETKMPINKIDNRQSRQRGNLDQLSTSNDLKLDTILSLINKEITKPFRMKASTTNNPANKKIDVGPIKIKTETLSDPNDQLSTPEGHKRTHVAYPIEGNIPSFNGQTIELTSTPNGYQVSLGNTPADDPAPEFILTPTHYALLVIEVDKDGKLHCKQGSTSATSTNLPLPTLSEYNLPIGYIQVQKIDADTLAPIYNSHIYQFDGAFKKAINADDVAKNSRTITQAHSFVAGDVVRFDGTNYEKARANSYTNSEAIGIVSVVVDSNTFILTSNGYIEGLPNLGSSIPQFYYLSATSDGELTSIQPTGGAHNTVIINPVFYSLDAHSGFVLTLPNSDKNPIVDGGVAFGRKLTIGSKDHNLSNDGYPVDIVTNNVTRMQVSDSTVAVGNASFDEFLLSINSDDKSTLKLLADECDIELADSIIRADTTAQKSLYFIPNTTFQGNYLFVNRDTAGHMSANLVANNLNASSSFIASASSDATTSKYILRKDTKDFEFKFNGTNLTLNYDPNYSAPAPKQLLLVEQSGAFTVGYNDNTGTGHLTHKVVSGGNTVLSIEAGGTSTSNTYSDLILKSPYDHTSNANPNRIISQVMKDGASDGAVLNIVSRVNTNGTLSLRDLLRIYNNGTLSFKIAANSAATLGKSDFTGSHTVNGSLLLGVEASKATITYTANITRTYTIPNVGSNSDFLMTAGSQTITGVKTFGDNIRASSIKSNTGSNSISISDPGNVSISGDLTLGTQTNKATISYPTNDAITVTIPPADNNSTFIVSNELDQIPTTAGATTFSHRGGYGLVPVGFIGAFIKGYYNSDGTVYTPISSNDELSINSHLNPKGWYVCDGAAVNVAASPIWNDANRYLPKLNDSRFIMGASTAGATGGSNTINIQHTHSIPAHYHGIGTGASLTASGQTLTADSSSTVASSTHTHLGGIGRQSDNNVRAVSYSAPTSNNTMTHTIPMATASSWTAGAVTLDVASTDAPSATIQPSISHTHGPSNVTGNIGLVTGGVDGNAAMTSGQTLSSTQSILPKYLSAYYIVRVF